MFNEQSLDFQRKIMARSGLGDDTYLPDGEPLHIIFTCIAITHFISQAFSCSTLTAAVHSHITLQLSALFASLHVCAIKSARGCTFAFV